MLDLSEDDYQAAQRASLRVFKAINEEKLSPAATTALLSIVLAQSVPKGAAGFQLVNQVARDARIVLSGG